MPVSIHLLSWDLANVYDQLSLTVLNLESIVSFSGHVTMSVSKLLSRIVAPDVPEDAGEEDMDAEEPNDDVDSMTEA